MEVHEVEGSSSYLCVKKKIDAVKAVFEELQGLEISNGTDQEVLETIVKEQAEVEVDIDDVSSSTPIFTTSPLGSTSPLSSEPPKQSKKQASKQPAKQEACPDGSPPVNLITSPDGSTKTLTCANGQAFVSIDLEGHNGTPSGCCSAIVKK
eukprot:sb/3473471/